MPKFSWEEGKTDEHIMSDGVILMTLADVTCATLQPVIESVSEEIGLKLDFRVAAGRYFVMCAQEDVLKIPVDLYEKVVADLSK